MQGQQTLPLSLHRNPPLRYDRGICSFTPSTSATHAQMLSNSSGEAMRGWALYLSSCPTNGTFSARAAGTTMTAHMSILSLDLYAALGWMAVSTTSQKSRCPWQAGYLMSCYCNTDGRMHQIYHRMILFLLPLAGQTEIIAGGCQRQQLAAVSQIQCG